MSTTLFFLEQQEGEECPKTCQRSTSGDLREGQEN